MNFNQYKLEIFIPETHLSALQQELQRLDAGHIGEYDCCTSYYEVKGTWRPLEKSNPYNGEKNEICNGTELKVEVLVNAKRIKETVLAVKKVHPYEEPVVNIIPVMSSSDFE